MASQVLLIAASAALAAGRPQYPASPAEAYPDITPVYNYQYGVNDQGHSESVFSQSEHRDGANAGGEYRVHLPDGRIQIVTYSAGPEGYNAVVSYEGEAVYPEAAPYQATPAPYQAAPAPYKAAPAPYQAAPVIKVAPIAPAYISAPAVKIVPVVKAPVVVAPAPVVKVAPVPYAPVVHHAPVVHPVVHHAPVVHHTPVYTNTGYHHAPLAPKYSPKKYGYTVVAKEAPVEEARAAKAVDVEEAVFEEVAKAAPSVPEKLAEVEPAEAVAKVSEADQEESNLPVPENRYRYRFF